MKTGHHKAKKPQAERANLSFIPSRKNKDVSEFPLLETSASKALVMMVPREEMIGCQYAVRFESRRNEIYVSPSIMSLIQSDYDRIKNTLRVKLIKGSPSEAVFQKIKAEIKKSTKT